MPLPAIRPGVALATALCCAAALGHSPGAGAQSTAAEQAGTSGNFHDFQISAGPLDQALATFGRISGGLISYDARLAAGKNTAGLSGSYSLERGLTQLLRGTGLQARRLERGGWLLEPVPTSAGRPVVLDTVEVTAVAPSLKDEVYRTAGSVNYLTREDIELFRGTSVGDIFQGIPGVLVGENRNSGGLDINVRGMQGQGRVPVLLDGSRQETTVYRGYAGVSSRTYIDPDLIGGIQIDKGPTMDAGGTGAIGGLVSMRTINADDILMDDNSFGIRVRGQAIGNNSGSAPPPGTPAGYHLGNFGDDGVYRTDCARPDICSQQHSSQPRTYELPDSFAPDVGMNRPSWYMPKSWAGSLALAQRFDKVDLVAAVAKRTQGNYYAGTHGPTPYMDLSDTVKKPFYTEVRPTREGATRFRAGERIVNSNYDSRSSLVKAKVFLPADQELEMSWMRYQSDYGELMPSQLLWFGSVRQTDNSHVTANTYTTRYRWQPADNAFIDLRANLWHTRTNSANTFYYFEIGDQSYTEGSSDVAELYKRTGLDLTNTSRFSAWGEPELRYGFSLQREDVKPIGNSSGGWTNTRPEDVRDGERHEYSAFLALKWQVLPQVTLDAGLRHTRYKAEDHKPQSLKQDSPLCVDTNGDGQCDPVYNRSRKHGTAPLASLTWEPLGGLQLYARYAEAFRMPSLFESTQGLSVSPTLDIELQPEHAKNREIGLNILHDGLLTDQDKFRVKLAYFRNHTKDYLTRTSVNLWEQPSGNSNDFFRLRNIDSVSVHGTELLLEYDAGPYFMELGGTKYQKIEVCHHGSLRRYDCTNYGVANSYFNNMIPPRWHASAKVGTRLFDRRLTMGVRGTFMGQRNMGTFHDDTKNGFLRPVMWHEYKVFDFFASWRVNDHFSLDFNIDNFTDRYYLDALSLGLVPAPGRTARLSGTLQF
ncbi:TonB-dependent receptor domain-containing protein [Kerstersia similis]|uniref:TonB-dependent receptor n=1 Tax=Kerstersia similis TaxID=206505 RepID=UPI0039EE6E68